MGRTYYRFGRDQRYGADSEFPDAPSGGTVITDAREVEMNDKLVFCALSDGSFEIFSLATKGSLYRSPSGSSSLTAISYSPSHKLLSTGSSRGVINMYNAASLNDLSFPYISWSRNAASIEDIAFSLSPSSASVELTTATDDGLSYIATISHGSLAGVEVIAEIIGGDPSNSRTSVVESCVSVLEQVSFFLEADTMQLMISIDDFLRMSKTTRAPD